MNKINDFKSKKIFEQLYLNYESLENMKFYEASSYEIIQLVKLHYKKDVTNILDLCCGSGILTKLLSENFNDVCITGVDISSKMLSLAQNKNILNSEFILLDGNEIQNINKKFDIIVSNYGIQWLKAESIKSISSILNDGGILVCSVPGYTTGRVDITQQSKNYVGNNMFKIIVEKSKKSERLKNINYAKGIVRVWGSMLDFSKIKEVTLNSNLKFVYETVKSITIEHPSSKALVKSMISRGTFGDVFSNDSTGFVEEIEQGINKLKDKYDNLSEECVTQYIIFMKGNETNE